MLDETAELVGGQLAGRARPVDNLAEAALAGNEKAGYLIARMIEDYGYTLTPPAEAQS